MVTWACEKFSDYILGRRFQIESDHKPLIPLLNTKLDRMPPRILRFRLRLAQHDHTIHHVPGVHLYTADTLSRAPVGGQDNSDLSFQKEVDVYVNCIVQECIPATEQCLDQYREAQEKDIVCRQVKEYCRNGGQEKGP